MKIKWKELIIALLIPLAVGGLSSAVSNTSIYSEIVRPPLSPPSWVFPVVWTILYLLMGFASYLVYTEKIPEIQKKNALIVYGVQLIFNFFWTIIFFGAKAYLFAFIWLIALWFFILATILMFSKINKTAGKLLVPYLIWVTFAGYLNFAIFLLN